MPAAQKIFATILGCGSSGGVPRVGNVWGDCDPKEPRNRRRRCSLLIEGYSKVSPIPTRVLIDTGCDLREQMLAAGADRIDAVLYTHEHADHTHGIDDLRVLALHMRRRVDVYFNKITGERLHEAFGYCFTTPRGSDYPAILNGHEISAGDTTTIDGPGGAISIQSFDQVHGSTRSLGYRVGGLAYSCDLSALPHQSSSAVKDLDIWIVDALRHTPHPSHLSLPETLALVERIAPRQAILTNMHVDMDYASLQKSLPSGVVPGFDGLRVDVNSGQVVAA
ncbi:MBL fold metallo-hydrolase [Devosia rhodophyticola]|uniref:MBL fold metallo-hydrolase n=1 Tax=Devosia rhodophyticola TaxID=3026423 RepID=A0ABY7YX58_9HYPH|nr:MBL fold metallo-hydrolase [Devosia rhodophyticola]WDR05807.1 MBL fold metallo-hydrolase [Devosia rhodophyticola]